MGIDPNRSSNCQLLQCLTVTVYILPMILHQFYQLFMLDIKLQSACNLLQKIIGVLCITCTYSLQKLVGYLKNDYDMFSDQREIRISEKYTKQSKVYTIVIIGLKYVSHLTRRDINDSHGLVEYIRRNGNG
ncbi:hypothetical protein HZH68_012584 [Vespula germanica]|uniref:Uncharacterized protein n=1 Tax=Vespula germanica TaxID=30212 RepID=A0A834JIR3_VESGE|nr:hypothetical protein HZH68_012584 [Vespula germanica]